MRQLLFIILVGLPSLASAGQKLRCDAFKLPKQVEVDTEFSGYFPKATPPRVSTSVKLGSIEDISRLSATTSFEADGSPGPTEIVYTLRGAKFTARSGELTLTRADKNETRGAHELKVKNLVLIEQRDDGATPRCFVDEDFTWSLSWDRTRKPEPSKHECRRVTLPQTTSVDPDEGFYVGSNGAPYLRTVQKFTTASGTGALSLVVSEREGQFSTSTEAGGVHLRLNLFGRQFRTVSAQLEFRRQKVSFAEGEVIVRVTGARFESDDDCLAPTPFDLAFSWRGVDPVTRGAQEK